MDRPHTNHLIDENSPYLLSHAHNPVDWWPWNDQALRLARQSDRPIFLSIGYAACHWCHVMERESFEDETTARFLNEHFVSIKVDREQRPDLDHIYMSFTTALTGHGGWPMSVFLTPDLKPFFAGTYFPPTSAYGRPSFMSVLSEVAEAWAGNRAMILNGAEDIHRRLSERLQMRAAPETLSPETVDRAARQLMRAFDHIHGGFGDQPKFPHALELTLFLRQYDRTGDSDYFEAVEKTLTAMAGGGIYDQLGGGFARYSTDRRWLVPHFEKMLYDNGLLVPLYAELYRLTENPLLLRVVRETLDWMLREMTDPSGGFYSALDADSEGEEGRFYTWSKDEIESVLAADPAALAIARYGVTAGGNFEGRNILHLADSGSGLNPPQGAAEMNDSLEAARAKLLAARSERVRPLTDDKILTSWNGLAVSALCAGYQITGDRRYVEAATRNASFVRDRLFAGDFLTHSFREGRHSEGQFLEDFAYYVRGLIDLYESDPGTSNEQWIEFAMKLAAIAVKLFQNDSGRFYLRPDGQTDLIVRPSEETDGSLPAPGSILIHALLKLARLTGNAALQTCAENGLTALSGPLSVQPNAMASAVLALDYHLSDKIEIVVVGDGSPGDSLVGKVHRTYLPNALLAVSRDGRSALPLFEGRSADTGRSRAFVCRNSACLPPVESAEALEKQLAGL